MAVIAPLLVEVPNAAPLPGGLLNVLRATDGFHDVTDPHVGGGVSWMPDHCGVAHPAPGVCDDILDIDPETEKTFDGIDYDEAQPFGLYKGIRCGLAGQDYEGRTRRAFESGESVALENVFTTLHLTGATNIGGGSARSTADAVGLLEQYAASTWSVRPLIHVTRYGAAHLLDDMVKSDGDYILWTKQGSPVVNGGGYANTGPGGSAVTGSQFWIYATGPTHLFRGPQTYNEVPAPMVNKRMGLAERLYTFGVDCGAVAVLVNPAL